MHTLQAKWFFFFTLLKVNYRLIYILAAPVGGSAWRALVQSPSLATAEGAEPSARGASAATTAHPPPATPGFVKTLRAPGEGVQHVSPSLPTGTFSFFHQRTTWACKSSGPALRPMAGTTALAHPGNVAQKGRGHRHQNAAALPEIRQQFWLFQNTAESKNLALDGHSRHTLSHKSPSFQIPGIQF